VVLILLIALVAAVLIALDWRGLQRSRSWWDRPLVRIAGTAAVVVGWHTIGFLLTVQLLFGTAIVAGLVAGFRQKPAP
jgi:type II secretory pathway component PulF